MEFINYSVHNFQDNMNVAIRITDSAIAVNRYINKKESRYIRQQVTQRIQNTATIQIPY